MTDIFEKCYKYTDAKDAISAGIYPYFHVLESGQDTEVTTYGKRVIMLGSNNYLGLIAAKEEIIHYVKHNYRPFIFSASIPPANAAGALAALSIIEQEPERIKKLWNNAEYMRTGFKELAIPFRDSQTPIIPVMTYENYRTFCIAKQLLEEGVYVNPVIAPAVEHGKALLRTSYTATHTNEQLDFALNAFSNVFTGVKVVNF